jgi:opacity protein-like surface antigen
MLTFINIKGYLMKKITTLGLLISLSIFASADTIDGTLAVDGGNALENIQQSANSQLNSGVNSAQDLANNSVKDVEAASTAPAAYPTATGTSFLEGPFVGLEGSAILASEADGKSESGMSYGLRFGAQNMEWRTMAVLEKFGKSDDANSYLRGLLQFDYYFLGMDNLMIDTYAIRPYAGVNAGAISLDTKTDNIKSLTYGAQLGATMNVMQNIDLDVGYRYNLSSSDIIDHTSGVSVGLHYKY